MSHSSPEPIQWMQMLQSWPMPGSPRPIAIISCDSIVDDAHLPAYNKAGFEVAGVYDFDPAHSATLASKRGNGRVYGSIEETASDSKVVYDIAVPPHRLTRGMTHSYSFWSY